MTAEFTASAVERQDGVLQYMTLSWFDSLGMEYRASFDRAGEHSPYVITGLRKGPPRLENGKPRSRYDAGYFPDRKLDPAAKGNREMVKAAMAFANQAPDSFAAYVKQQNDTEARMSREADEGHAAKVRAGLHRFADEYGAQLKGPVAAFRELADELNVEQLNQLSRIIHGLG